ncbi:hypothetical protein G6L58_27020 [Agrobacterium tumefaciens]|uniref:glycine-rich domain-containing protein n=1 Tax=Agrobacterium tumefaciens TaxID=358 RepID=UPI000EF25DE7|nr:hypothetical protein At1D1108_34290 [Agrobacterium tumefaciens]NSY94077.1 hypothetical protein [Agrobacterium tumefaciens]
MKYHAPYGSTDPNASYVDKDVPGAVRGSAVPAAAIEDPQRELVDFITKSGLAPGNALQLALAVQSGKVNFAVAGGTANALTASLSPAPASLFDGLAIRLKIATPNTGAATLNLNGLGVFPIQNISGGALAAGDLVGIRELIYFSGAWLVTNITAGRLLNVQFFKTAGAFTYTPTPGTAYVEVEVQGAGGGGGGVPATDGSQTAAGGGGGSGAWAYKIIRSAFAGVTVTVGAAGSVGPAVSGGAGGASSFGALVSAAGGAGGVTRPLQVSGTTFSASGGAGGISGVSGDLNSGGITGQTMLVAGSVFTEPVQTASRFAGGYGSGGNGQTNMPSAPIKTGAVAGAGLVIVREYGA